MPDKLRTRRRILAVIMMVTMAPALYMGFRSYDLRHWVEFAILILGTLAVFFFFRRAADG